MKRGKLIAIEGSDFSGKATQTKLLYDQLISRGISTQRSTFPRYDTPTGRIVGGAIQGKKDLVEEGSWFEEGAGNVPYRVASLLYAADREYNRSLIDKALESGEVLILDRYVQSNMAHQGGKIKDFDKRQDHYKFLEKLEYGLLGLPKPDLTFFLYVPFENAEKLRADSDREKDEIEEDENYLRNSERTYLELAEIYNWKMIDCISNGNLKTRLEIHEEIYSHVKNFLAN